MPDFIVFDFAELPVSAWPVITANIGYPKVQFPRAADCALRSIFWDHDLSPMVILPWGSDRLAEIMTAVMAHDPVDPMVVLRRGNMLWRSFPGRRAPNRGRLPWQAAPSVITAALRRHFTPNGSPKNQLPCQIDTPTLHLSVDVGAVIPG